MDTQNELKEFFVNFFVPIDNIPEDTAWRNSISMEARASMLIDNASLEDLSSLFNVCINENVLTLKLPAPLSVQVTAPTTFPAPTTVGYTYVDVCYSWNFSSYCITRTETTTDYFQISGRWHIKDSLFERSKCESLLTLNLHNAKPSFYWNDSGAVNILHNCSGKLQKELKKHFTEHSTFQLAEPLTSHNTPGKICRFFRKEALPLSPISLSHHFSQLEEGVSTIPFEPVISGQSEAESVHDSLKSMFSAKRLLDSLLEYRPKAYDRSQQFLFPFKDKDNYTVMTVLKCYDDTFQQKSFLPVTRWQVKQTLQQYCMAVPGEKKLSLFNLQELAAYPDAPVILTDSLEIAALNQAKIEPEKLIFTSFICDDGHYDQVDWKPLKGRLPYLLVTNHSGRTFEETCLKAGKLADYLKESQAIELQFVRVPVWYRPLPVLHSIQELISAYKAAPPQPYKEDIRILTPEEFETIRGMAEQRIGIPPEAWWKTERERIAISPQTSTDILEVANMNRLDYILWPFLVRGKSTLLYASKGIGKSALAHSIAACLSSQQKKRLFIENSWGASKGNFDSYKVLYLDFENQPNEHLDLLKRMCRKYWHTEKSETEKDAKNFLWKNMPEIGLSGINFTLPENHQKLLDLLDKAQNEGESNHPVDVLIIDTYHEFTSLSDEVNTHRGLRELLRILNERNLATLILNHAKASDSQKMSGYNIIKESFAYVMKLRREGEQSRPLSEPITVSFDAVRTGWLGREQTEFKIYQPESPGRWHLYSPERSATEERNRIRDYYINVEKFGKEETAKLLGTSPASLYRDVKDAD